VRKGGADVIHAQNVKKSIPITPQSVATNATATGNVDLLGYDYCSIDVILDSAGATSSNPAVLKLTECDTTVVSSFVAITAFTGDNTSGGFTIPAADTAAAQVVRFNVNAHGRKRYLKVSITPAGAAQIVGAVAECSRAQSSPTTDALAGCAEIVYG